MLVAFEGPTNVGKTFAADKLSGGQSIRGADRAMYKSAQELVKKHPGTVMCFDEVAWFSYLTRSLAWPAGHDYPISPVFAMPDTHLVFKLYKHGLAPEGSALEALNQVYTNTAHSLMALNESREYTLFKSVTIMEVSTSPLDGGRQQEVMEFSSPLHPWWGTTQTRLVHDDLSLLDLLLTEEANR